MGPNSHQDLCNLWAKVHRTFSLKAKGIDLEKLFAIKVGGCIKSTEILHVFGPQIFWGEGPPNFWTWIIKLRQFLIMWPSFTAIGRGTSKNAWRKKKTH